MLKPSSLYTLIKFANFKVNEPHYNHKGEYFCNNHFEFLHQFLLVTFGFLHSFALIAKMNTFINFSYQHLLFLHQFFCSIFYTKNAFTPIFLSKISHFYMKNRAFLHIFFVIYTKKWSTFYTKIGLFTPVFVLPPSVIDTKNITFA